eukprot:57466-Amphidinium_carterae.1
MSRVLGGTRNQNEANLCPFTSWPGARYAAETYTLLQYKRHFPAGTRKEGFNASAADQEVTHYGYQQEWVNQSDIHCNLGLRAPAIQCVLESPLPALHTLAKAGYASRQPLPRKIM